MPTALVIGASRGLGLEFARQYLDQGWRVLASHRSEEDRIRLRDLGAETYRIDVLDDRDLAGFAWQLDGERIDVVVVNAGVYGPRESNLSSPPTVEQFDSVMRTNVYAVMKLLPLLAPVVTASRGTLALLSSRMASISTVGGNYGGAVPDIEGRHQPAGAVGPHRTGAARRSRPPVASGLGPDRHGWAQCGDRGRREHRRHARSHRRPDALPGRRLLRLARPGRALVAEMEDRWLGLAWLGLAWPGLAGLSGCPCSTGIS